jgi:hypothetical protein
MINMNERETVVIFQYLESQYPYRRQASEGEVEKYITGWQDTFRNIAFEDVRAGCEFFVKSYDEGRFPTAGQIYSCVAEILGADPDTLASRKKARDEDVAAHKNDEVFCEMDGTVYHISATGEVYQWSDDGRDRLLPDTETLERLRDVKQ